MASQLTLSYISGEETVPPEIVPEGPPSEIIKEGRVWIRSCARTKSSQGVEDIENLESWSAIYCTR